MLFAVAAGAGVAAQAIINARLRFVLGAPIWAACAQFIVGLTMLAVVAILTQQPVPAGGSYGRAPWWMWTGGIFGATFILMTVIATPRLGTGLMMGASIVGQLGAALVIDHFGWFGATVIPISMTRMLGAALLAAGAFLIRWT